MTLRRRFALVVATQTALLLLVLAGLLFVVLQRFLVAGEEQRLGDALAYVDLDRIAEGVHEGELRPDLGLRAGFPRDMHVRLVSGGRVLVASEAFPDLPASLPLGFSRSGEHQLLVRSVREEDAVVEVQLALDRLGVRTPLAAYLRALAVTVPLMMLLAAFVAGATAGRLLAPLRALERTARSVAGGGGERLRAPIPGAGGRDELASLARTLQTSFRRLADSMDREREFVRAAAHDLRSPLTALRARIQGVLARPRSEAAYRTELRELDRDVVRMTRLAEHLLLLARDEHALVLAPVGLTGLAGECIDRARSAHPEVDLDLDAGEEVRIRGDAALLTHLLDNLLDNAVRYGRGSDVTVTVGRRGNAPLLTVRDRGPGADPGTLERLGEAFFRGDPSRSVEGSGLGLAIVQRIAGLHGATVTMTNAEPDGFEVAVRFPET